MMNSKALWMYLEALCDLWEDSVNVLVKEIAEGTDIDRHDIAYTIGYVLGLNDGDRVPAKILCIDFEKSLGIQPEDGFIRGKLTEEAFGIWEKKLLPMLEELLEKHTKALHKFILNKYTPDEVLEAFIKNRELDPRLERFKVDLNGDELTIMLCYKDPKINEAVASVRYGGMSSGIVANAMALKHGYQTVKFEGAHLNDEGCAVLKFRLS